MAQSGTTTVRLDGKPVLELERDVARSTPATLLAYFAKKKLIPESRRGAIRMGAETKLLEQLPQDMPLSGDMIDIKTIPGGTIKGSGQC